MPRMIEDRAGRGPVRRSPSKGPVQHIPGMVSLLPSTIPMMFYQDPNVAP